MVDSYRRRAVLATAGTMFVAGCSAGNSDDGTDAAGTDERTGTRGGSVTEGLMTDTVDVPPNGYHYWAVTVDDPYSVNIEVLVREGPNVDLLFFEPSEFEAYAAGEEFDLVGASFYDTDRTERWGALPEGDSVVVVDNTPASSATPEGQSTRVHVSIDLDYDL